MLQIFGDVLNAVFNECFICFLSGESVAFEEAGIGVAKDCSRNYPGGPQALFVLLVESVLLTMCPRGGGWGGNLRSHISVLPSGKKIHKMVLGVKVYLIHSGAG